MPKTEDFNYNNNNNSNEIWNPPSDRVLIMKAKVKTGWSSRSSTQQLNKATAAAATTRAQSSTNSTNTQISDAEFLEIENVMQRAALVEKKEMSRINRLYDRFSYLNKPKGNGDTSCIVCGTIFGAFSASPRICSMCFKNCCNSCSVDSLNPNKQSKWFCKICSEYYEFLKKSGAWFNQRVPPTITINSEDNHNNNNSNSKPVMSENNISRVHSRSSSNNFVNEQHPSKAVAVSAHDDDDDEDIEVKSSHSTSSSILHSSSHSHHLNTSNNSSHSISGGGSKTKPIASSQQKMVFDDSSLSGVSDSLSINETKSPQHLSGDHEQQPQLTSPSSSFRELSLKSPVAAATTAEEEFKDDSIDLQFQKYAQQKQTKVYDGNLDDIDADDVLTSTKYDAADNQFVPTGGKKSSFGSIKSKISSISSSTQQHHKPSITTPPPVEATSLGNIKFSLLYNSTLQQLSIHLFAAYDLPARDSNGFSDPYVKIHLLPSLAKSTKLRSKTVYKTLNPEFHETLNYGGISITDLDSKTLRLTVLDEDKIGFDYIGEFRVPLKSIQIDEINDFDAKLEEIKELGDDLDTHFRGKINFALKYSKQTQTLFVKVIRCTQLLPMDNGKSSDPFVQIALTPLEKSNHKHKQRTSVKWKTLDPEYMEEFKFPNLDLKTLLSKTIEITVWDKDFTSNDFIGVVKLGEKEAGDELTHFYTMIKNPDIYHEQWHTLKVDVEQEKL